MRRGFILFAVFLLAISMVSASDVILKLSSPTNAHGEIWDGTAYTTNITYSSIFGGVYNGTNPNTCTGVNRVLRLSSPTNAHAEAPNETAYNTQVCYGDLQCTYRTGACNADERCVVTLSASTNAHLAGCNVTGSYTNKICCKSGAPPSGNCSSLTTKDACWASLNNCTWTPLYDSAGIETTNNSNGGGCCDLGEKWNPIDRRCEGSYSGTCYSVWAIDNQIFGDCSSSASSFCKSGSTYRYCAKVTSGLSYGYWYDVNKF